MAGTIAAPLYLLHFGADRTPWSHAILPRPRGTTAKGWFPHGEQWSPPADLCSKYYPALGPYRTDPKIIRQHLQMIRNSGINNIVVPFFLSSDEVQRLHPQTGFLLHGERGVDTMIPMLLNIAAEAGIQVSFLLPDWHGRGSVDSIAARIRYLVEAYGRHSAFYPLILVENPKLDSPQAVLAWIDLIESFEGADAPIQLIATFQGQITLSSLQQSGIHGVVVDVSEPAKAEIFERAQKANLKTMVRISPGRDATKIKPWASDQVMDRRGGQTYRDAWDAALSTAAQVVLIDSFNDWCAGTQIEPAAGKHTNEFKMSDRLCGTLLNGLGLPAEYSYPGYGNGDDPSRYIEITREFTSRLKHISL